MVSALSFSAKLRGTQAGRFVYRLEIRAPAIVGSANRDHIHLVVIHVGDVQGAVGGDRNRSGTRCRILLALLDGVTYPGQIANHLGLTRSNVSNHLACLRGCGLVVAT